MAHTFDCIVIGLGGFGSSALYHLARNGLKVIGIDRFPPAHRFGSSHGRTRMIRKAYFEHPDYVPLLHRAYALWAELEEDYQEQLYFECGLVLAGDPKGETISGARHAAKLHNLTLEEIARSDAASRFPGFQFRDDHEVVFEPQAGYLRVEDCVLAHLEAAERLGAIPVFGEAVQSWSVTEHGVCVETKDERFEAASLIIAGGAWSNQLLNDVLPPLQVLRKVQFWCPVQPEWSAASQQNPAFYFDMPEGGFYGFPSQEGCTLKVAQHSGGEVVDDPLLVDYACKQSDRDPIEQFVKSTLRGVSPWPVEHAVCMYTMSPDGHFIIDRHPLHSHVVMAAGFSGHGFKFTSVIGEALTELVMTGRTSLPMDFLKLDRFGHKQGV
ncbi:N-methyl-L-tryptophan oxidase [Planctomicrobium piriforme]|uniref:Sarcosine oxidase n=1 Tax=Planctomicrobium piriforme TaxID=1576369 RepID=A0A1I3F168_9PLAN|nr:N-methyl-L-tryptophan oxidase [Planctomicrobium piriforme]SFI04986.1 sarcosine oxidase [Planctomicrobium piriforme]